LQVRPGGNNKGFFTPVGSGLAPPAHSGLERLARDKHSNLFCTFTSEKEKKGFFNDTGVSVTQTSYFITSFLEK
jgi:hypothetical protein